MGFRESQEVQAIFLRQECGNFGESDSAINQIQPRKRPVSESVEINFDGAQKKLIEVDRAVIS